MMTQNRFTLTRLHQIISLIIATSSFTGIAKAAEEKKTYTRPPFAAFSSQLFDALLGNSGNYVSQ